MRIRSQQKWRPSDTDRDRYSSAISQAYSEGRITAEDMEARTAQVYQATSIGQLDALVEDLPGPSVPAPAPVTTSRAHRSRGTAVAVATAAVIGVAGATVFVTTDGDSDHAADSGVVDEEEPVAQPDVDLPDIATEKLDIYTPEGIAQMWDALAAAGVTHVHDMDIRPDRANLTVLADTERRALSRVQYQGGFVTPPVPVRDLSADEPNDQVLFALTELTPDAVHQVIAEAPAAAGAPDAEVGYILVDRKFGDGGVTLRAYLPEAPGVGYVAWDVTGRQVLAVH